MKTKLVFSFLILIMLTVNIKAQEKLTYSEVVKVDSTIKKEELFQRARGWFNQRFNSSQNVLNIQDKESGELAGKAIINYKSNIFSGSAGTTGVIRFLVSVKVKDGRYKYEITDFNHEGTNPQLSFGLILNTEKCPYNIKMGTENWNNKVWKDIRTQIESAVIPLINSLKPQMEKPSTDNNW